MPLLHGLVARLAAVRVDPDDAVREPVQPGHLVGEQARRPSFPAVAEDDDDGAPGHAALAPAVEERLARLAEPGAARPVRHLLPRLAQRGLGVPAPQGPR